MKLRWDQAHPQNVAVVLWSFWKMSRASDAWPEMRKGLDRGVQPDIMGFAYALMLAEWEKLEERESHLYDIMGQSRILQLPIQLFDLVARWNGGLVGGPPELLQVSAAYKKIGMLLDFVESQAQRGDVLSFLRAIETFGAGIGTWLKVAADCKAHIVEASIRRRRPSSHEACAELGTYVGYTALRLARWISGSERSAGRCVSLEVDAVHALVTRHQLSLACLAPAHDVWIGQALDLIPRLVEELGDRSLHLVFMDHRGTRFHSDLFRLQWINTFPPGATHLCDNTLKPGAPLCLYLMAYDPLRKFGTATNWSLNEFAHWNSEDWMLVNGL